MTSPEPPPEHSHTAKLLAAPTASSTVSYYDSVILEHGEVLGYVHFGDGGSLVHGQVRHILLVEVYVVA